MDRKTALGNLLHCFELSPTFVYVEPTVYYYIFYSIQVLIKAVFFYSYFGKNMPTNVSFFSFAPSRRLE